MRFTLLLSFFCIPLCAMEQKLPSMINGIKSDEVHYNYLLEAKLISYYNKKFSINFDRAENNDPIIARLVTTVINRAFILQNPALKKRFCKSFNNPKSLLNATYDIIQLDEAIADEAARSVLAERRLLTFIIKGTVDQPWLVRPEFDQQWKAIRSEIKSHTQAASRVPWFLVRHAESNRSDSLSRVYDPPYTDHNSFSYLNA